jgi:hypothetical protein
MSGCLQVLCLMGVVATVPSEGLRGWPLLILWGGPCRPCQLPGSVGANGLWVAHGPTSQNRASHASSATGDRPLTDFSPRRRGLARPSAAGRPDWLVVFTVSCWAAAERSGVKLAML